ncbi:hypothetical protein WR164_00980 [Philodulcilactobacillus myokoensis]|uniref:Uncharacterized protein n=1 Tax=Philodulcilactobacillus myokoensis TaxID=2929573 RepID=A0A9W6ESG1_9LACO|nr:hypothetical protein WR164_00980 [Philodulcilactobacillus myokoensis]
MHLLYIIILSLTLLSYLYIFLKDFHKDKKDMLIIFIHFFEFFLVISLILQSL